MVKRRSQSHQLSGCESTDCSELLLPVSFIVVTMIISSNGISDVRMCHCQPQASLWTINPQSSNDKQCYGKCTLILCLMGDHLCSSGSCVLIAFQAQQFNASLASNFIIHRVHHRMVSGR